MDSSAKQRRNVSLTCTECRKKRYKRRKAYTAELSNFRVSLSRMAAKLRSGITEEILLLIQEIRNLPTDQDAVNFFLTDTESPANEFFLAF
ncbi:hypothetical protein N7453_002160 [Penicillium expansum]|nr:hypothetical protein N7453_002160 [Penicillium expansum]